MRYVFLSGVLAAALLLAGCTGGQRGDGTGQAQALPPATAGEQNEQAYHKITAEQAKEMMDEGGVTVVDVRTQAEHDAEHIPGAVLVPNETIHDEPPEALPELDAVLLVHCRSGVRSKQASDKLVEMGYTQVYDFGGIRDWPYDTVTGD